MNNHDKLTVNESAKTQVPAMIDTAQRVVNTEVADIDLLEVFKRSKNPVFDLMVLRQLDAPDRAVVIKAIMHSFLAFDTKLKGKVVFLGDRNDAEHLFENVPEAKHELLNNPSIVELLKQRWRDA